MTTTRPRASPPITCTCPATGCGLPAVCVDALNPGEPTFVPEGVAA
jgi:hypothetical protein